MPSEIIADSKCDVYRIEEDENTLEYVQISFLKSSDQPLANAVMSLFICRVNTYKMYGHCILVKLCLSLCDKFLALLIICYMRSEFKHYMAIEPENGLKILW